jgi:hypothetical protein
VQCCAQVVGSSVRLAGLRPKKGAGGKGVAARYRPADNTMAVSFEDPRKRVKEPAIQKVGGAHACARNALVAVAHISATQALLRLHVVHGWVLPNSHTSRWIWQVQGFYRQNGRNLCFEGTVRVCMIGKNSKGETKLFAPKGDGTTYIAGESGT